MFKEILMLVQIHSWLFLTPVSYIINETKFSCSALSIVTLAWNTIQLLKLCFPYTYSEM